MCGTSEGTVICKSYKCIHNHNINDGIINLVPTEHLLLTLKLRNGNKEYWNLPVMSLFSRKSAQIFVHEESISDSKQKTKSGRNQM